MDGFEEFKKFETHFLRKVDVQTSDSGLDRAFLSRLLQPVSESRSVRELHDGIITSFQTLHKLHAFHRCKIEVHPGNEVDTALVEYHFQWLPRWNLRVWMHENAEGGAFSPSLTLRNVRGTADTTRLLGVWSPNTKTWGLHFFHVDPGFVPGEWELKLGCHYLREQKDLNLFVRTTGVFASINDVDKVHKVTVGRNVRTNFPRIDSTSLSTLRSGVLTSEQYYLRHMLTSNTLNSPLLPTAGYLATLTNQLAVGQGLRQHSLEAQGSWYAALYRSLTLELTGKWKWTVPWEFSREHINDRLRANYVKGFVSAGERDPPADSTLAAHFQAYGDNPGTTNLLSLEAKLRFYETPLLRRLGLTPFLYANVLGVGLSPVRTGNVARLRAACGLGCDWVTGMGRLELSYTAKAFTRAGDLPAEFQVLLYDR